MLFYIRQINVQNVEVLPPALNATGKRMYYCNIIHGDKILKTTQQNASCMWNETCRVHSVLSNPLESFVTIEVWKRRNGLFMIDRFGRSEIHYLETIALRSAECHCYLGMRTLLAAYAYNIFAAISAKRQVMLGTRSSANIIIYHHVFVFRSPRTATRFLCTFPWIPTAFR